MDDALDILLRPHRSLSPAGFWVVMGILAVWSFAGGLVFWLVGAWPVIGFVGLDVALVYWAFRASYGDQRAYERLRLIDGTLHIEQVDKRGATAHYAIPAYWLRVRLDGPQRLVLASHGKELVVGAFLSADQRVTVAETLSAALMRARATPA